MQIYTNFESNSQLRQPLLALTTYCFRCKFTQILKAIHNNVYSDALPDVLFPMQIYTNFESNSQRNPCSSPLACIVSDANLHKF